MLPDGASVPAVDAVDADACRRLLIRCAGELAAGGRRLEALELGAAVAGPCAAALRAVAQSLAGELRVVGTAIEGQARELERWTGR
jgi:hypothetical protein